VPATDPYPEIERWIRDLAALERPSASEGERWAAELIAGRLGELGWPARVEAERAHGGYWWPLGIPNAVAAAASLWALRRPRSALRRAAGALLGAVGAAAVWDDVAAGRLWFRRAVLPHRSTWNVIAEAGERSAERTVVLIAHHDAAHTGLVFHPALPRLTAERLPERHDRSVPVLYGVFLGPALLAAGAALGVRPPLTLAALVGSGAAAAMADIGARPVVPGANDNLSAVAVVFAVAHALAERPVEGVRVLLLSTGSEESFMEGMHGFARRHFATLPRDRTELVCVECVGSPILYVLDGEGMLRMRDYAPEVVQGLAEAARAEGVELRRGLRTVASTDALVAVRHGYRVATLGGVDHTGFPANYHWPSDTFENLDWSSIRAAAAICERFVRDRAAQRG
jgi:hypothetical protein